MSSGRSRSGGYIRVESVLGHGTVFAVYLPRAEGAEPAGAGRRARLADIPRVRETVLLVEDNADVRDLAHEILRALGYTVLSAADGASALSAAEEHPGSVHLLIADVIMPRMSGRDIADRLRTRYAGLRVLYISGYMSDALDPEELRRPGTALLDKPFTPEMLGLKVREVLDGAA